MYIYDPDFYRYINAGSLRAAEIVLPLLQETLPLEIDNVLDVGCGAGAWLSQWQRLGVRIEGVDGDYLPPEALLIPHESFSPHNLELPFELQRRFSLVQCLEVAEHLPEPRARSLVSDLCRHSDIVMFSAAPPGQGGENHINEQPYQYWADLFRSEGYRAYDPLRPLLAGNREVMPWYRYNLLLFVGEHAHPDCHQALAHSEIPDGIAPRDVAPLWYRLRRKIIGMLPPALSTMIAVVKKNAYRKLKAH